MNLTNAANCTEATYKRVLRETLEAVIAEVVGSRKHRVNWTNWYYGQGNGPVVTIFPSNKSKMRLVFQLQNRSNGYEASARIAESSCELREWGRILFFTWDELDSPWKCGDKLGAELDVLMDDFIRELQGLM